MTFNFFVLHRHESQVPIRLTHECAGLLPPELISDN